MEQFDRVEPVLMVRNVSRALAFYARLGFEEVFRDDDHAPMFVMVRRDAACLAMQWHDYEGIAGTEATVTNVSEGTNDTVAVTLSTGVVGFHKSFRGASISVARAYQQDGYQQPLHEVAAWRVAATLGAPWIEIVTPTVIRTINNEPGSFARMMTGYEGETSPHYLRHAAALFDALIGQQDRHSGNYLINGINGLGLIDHGYAFARPGDSCNFSEFVADRHGGGRTADLTEHERSALNRLLHSPRLAGVEGIIQPDRVAALGRRAGRMLQENRIVAAGDY